MSRRICTLGLCAFLLVLITWSGRQSVSGDEPAVATAEQKAAHLAEMRTIAKSINVFELSGDKRTAAPLVDQPVLGYRDDTRKLFDSTMWIWSGKGRPSAILAVEYYPQRPAGARWLYEIASLSPNRIVVERGKELKWTAPKPGLQLTTIPGAPVPADKAVARLAQMKQLQRRFAAHERANVGGRIELRPLPRALHRYEHAAAGVIDGAVFSFANGTNPEVLWIIEAHRDEDKKESWQFGLVQMSGAEVFAELDGKEIWKCTEADPPAQRDSYTNGWLGSGKDEK